MLSAFEKIVFLIRTMASNGRYLTQGSEVRQTVFTSLRPLIWNSNNTDCLTSSFLIFMLDRENALWQNYEQSDC